MEESERFLFHLEGGNGIWVGLSLPPDLENLRIIESGRDSASSSSLPIHPFNRW